MRNLGQRTARLARLALVDSIKTKSTDRTASCVQLDSTRPARKRFRATSAPGAGSEPTSRLWFRKSVQKISSENPRDGGDEADKLNVHQRAVFTIIRDTYLPTLQME